MNLNGFQQKILLLLKSSLHRKVNMKVFKMTTEKSVLLISNSASITEEPNSLSSFSGSIPLNFLKTHKSWKVALHSCGLHLNLKQKLCPKYESHPALIHITYKDLSAALQRFEISDMQKLPLDMFEKSQKLFLDNGRHYSAKTVVQHLQNQTVLHLNNNEAIWFGIPLKYDRNLDCVQFGQFETSGEDSEKRISNYSSENEKTQARTFVFMHEHFKKGLDVQFQNNKEFKITFIDGELYYYFYNSPTWKSKDFYPFKARNNNFPIEVPHIIQIVSPNVEHSISNNTYTQCLKEFTVNDIDIKKYIHREFENLEFFETSNKIIDGFELKFVDEKYQQIRLGQGIPSWIKLVFKSIMEKIEHIRISSEPGHLHQNNNISKFGVELPKQLDFTWKKNPRVSLTRISLKNKWNIMPGLHLDFAIYNIEDNKFKSFKCQKANGGPRSCAEIKSWFAIETGKMAGVRVKKRSGALSLEFIKKSIMIIGRDLGQILGFSFADSNNTLIRVVNRMPSTNSFISKNDTIENDVQATINLYRSNNDRPIIAAELFFKSGDIVIHGENNSKFNINFPSKNIELYPNDLYIYANIVKPTIVVGKYRKLLRIVPLPYDKKDQNITIDFSRPEFHSLSELSPRILDFEITTIDGRVVEPFDANEHVYMNLQFVYE